MVGDVVLEEYYIVELEHQEEQQEIVIDGIWDLTMTASAKAEVEDRCQMLTGGPRVAGIESFGGVFVKQANGPWCQLRKSGSDRKGEPQHWSPAGALPDDAVLVVRTAALNYLIGRMFARQEQAPQSEQPTKSHSVDAVASAAGLTPEAFEIAAQDLESKVGRRKAVDAFLASCTHTAQEPILQKHIWRSLHYKGPRTFQYWLKKQGPLKESRTIAERVPRILAMPIPKFLEQLRRKQLI